MKEQIDRKKIRERLKGVELLICDADGTIRKCTVKGQGTPRRPGEWELMPRVREAFSVIDWSRVRLAVATNQPDVAEGKVSLKMARALIDDALDAAGVPEERRHVEICPHPKHADCVCAKPRPGMLVRILDATGVTPGRALAIGNAAIDRRAATRTEVRYLDRSEFFTQKKALGAIKRLAESVTPT
jgi:D-glycero-D-manno-heptose 1,7-bisphosphate phosphatase